MAKRALSDEPPLLSCRKVDNYFGALAAVRDLSLEAWPGEVLGTSGPNGVGKTTPCRSISSLGPADSGEIIFDGRNFAGRRAKGACRSGIARTLPMNAAFDRWKASGDLALDVTVGGLDPPEAVPRQEILDTDLGG